MGVTGAVLESASVTAGPPAIAMRLSLPPAVNASDLLSGDQKVKVPPSVPGSGRDVNSPSDRSHNRLVSRESPAANTTKRPSGDGVIALGPWVYCVPGGASSANWIGAACGAGC